MPLPPSDEPFDADSYHAAGWPISIEKTELIDGAVVWSGDFTDEDAERLANLPRPDDRPEMGVHLPAPRRLRRVARFVDRPPDAFGRRR
jgi:hypothetical protein